MNNKLVIEVRKYPEDVKEHLVVWYYENFALENWVWQNAGVYGRLENKGNGRFYLFPYPHLNLGSIVKHLESVEMEEPA